MIFPHFSFGFLYSVYAAGLLTGNVKMLAEFQTFLALTIDHPIFYVFALPFTIAALCLTLEQKFGVKCTT